MNKVCFLPLWLCVVVRPSLCGRFLQLAAELDICNPAAKRHYSHWDQQKGFKDTVQVLHTKDPTLARCTTKYKVHIKCFARSSHRSKTRKWSVECVHFTSKPFSLFVTCFQQTHQQTPESEATFFISDSVFTVEATLSLSHSLHRHISLCISTQRLHGSVATEDNNKKTGTLITLQLQTTVKHVVSFLTINRTKRWIKTKTGCVCIPVSSLNAGYVNAEVLTLLHCDHLRCRLKAELLHHGLEVVLTRTLRRDKKWSCQTKSWKVFH